MKEHQHIEWKQSWRDEYLKAAISCDDVQRVETWGRGIERIMQACVDAGIPAPELRYAQTGLWVNFSLSADDVKTGSEKILILIKDNSRISARKIAAEQGLTSRAVEKQIAQLKE